LDNLNGILVVNVDNGAVKFASDMGDEDTWALLMMALFSQSHKLGIDKTSAHELLDVAWKRVEEQN